MGKVDVVLWKWRGRLPKEFLEELNEALAFDTAAVWDIGFSMGVDSALGCPLPYLAGRLHELQDMKSAIKQLEEALDDIKFIQMHMAGQMSLYVYRRLEEVYDSIDEAIDMLRKEADKG